MGSHLHSFLHPSSASPWIYTDTGLPLDGKLTAVLSLMGCNSCQWQQPLPGSFTPQKICPLFKTPLPSFQTPLPPFQGPVTP